MIKRKLFGKTIKQTFLAMPAAALMLGASQAQTTVGINFQGNYGGSYSGAPVTVTDFGVPLASWFTAPDAATGSMAVTPVTGGSLSVNWSAANTWCSGLYPDIVTNGTTVSTPGPLPGDGEVLWGYLDDGSPGNSVSVTGLNTIFKNGYVIQTIAAEVNVTTFKNSIVTDGTTTSTNVYSDYWYPVNFFGPPYVNVGTAGLSAQTTVFTNNSVTVSGGTSGSGRGPLCGFIITDQPVVTQSPQSITNNQGSPLILSAVAIGIPPLSFQWRFNGAPISGATYASYTNASLSPSTAGNYDVVVTNMYGTNTSSIATVGVNQIPIISKNLSSTTNNAYVGFPTLLSIGVGGAQPLSYQWLINGALVSGATNASFIASNSVIGISSYNVSITNLYGSTNSSTNCIYTVSTPDNYTVKIGLDAPYSYWPLNETAGTIAYDYSGYGHNGSLSNNVTLGVAGPQPPTLPGFAAGKTAYQFDGSTSLINCGTNASLGGTNDFTVEAWIKTTASASGEIVCQRDGGSGDYIGAYRCYVNAGGTITFLLYGTGGYQFDFTTTRSIGDGNWHQVAFVRSGTTGIIYVDGANVGSASGTIQALSPTIQTYIGCNPRDNNNYFSGSIADVAIYNHALTPGRIISHYVTASGLPLKVSFIQGGIIQDSKPAGTIHNGLNYGTTWLSSSTDLNSVNRTGVEQFTQTNNTQITIPPTSDFTTTNGSICFWVNYALPLTGLPGSGSEAAILFDRRTSNNGLIIGINGLGSTSGELEVQYYYTNSTGTNTSTETLYGNTYIVDGLWHYIVLTYDQTSNGLVSVYIDGASTPDIQTNNPGGWSWPASQEVEIGRSHDSYWKIYDGQMDDFRLYSRILTQAEIAEIYSAANGDMLIDPSTLNVRFNFTGNSALFGNSLVWPYGTLQSSPALGSGAVWTSLTNAVSPQPTPFNPAVPAMFYRASFAP